MVTNPTEAEALALKVIELAGRNGAQRAGDPARAAEREGISS